MENSSQNPKSSRYVLIIEDESMVGEVICEQLKLSGFDVASVLSTRLAWIEIKKRAPNALILDLNLEGENGLDFLPEFKKQFPNVPVMILTGMGYDQETIETALQNGASAYFSKESGMENVPHIIERLLDPKPIP
jgi:DNA-binding response OmpR family regulator